MTFSFNLHAASLLAALVTYFETELEKISR